MAAVETGLVEEFDRLLLVSIQLSNAQWIPDAVSEHNSVIDAIQGHDSEKAFQLAHTHILVAQQRHIAVGSPGKTR